jgi:hypothetical protein
LQNQVRYETSVKINTIVPKYLKTALNKATRSYNVALALKDLKMYKKNRKKALKNNKRL